MNLSPSWCDAFEAENIEVVHWSSLGAANAPDTLILEYAKKNGYSVFTNDLDFGAILAATGATSPSVLQIRAQALLPKDAKDSVLAALRQFKPYLVQGVLIIIKPSGARATLLPLRGSNSNET